MKIKTLLIITMASLAMLSCHHGPKPQRVKTNLPISMSKPAKGDKAIYGAPWSTEPHIHDVPIG